MRKLLAVLFIIILLLAGCSTREAGPEQPEEPDVPVQFGPVPESAAGIYQGELIPPEEQAALLVQAGVKLQVPAGAQYQDFNDWQNGGGASVLVRFSGGQSLDYLAVSELEGEEAYYRSHFPADRTRREAWVNLGDFAPGEVRYQLHYRVDGAPQRTAYLHKRENGSLFVSYKRDGEQDGYADSSDAQALTGLLEHYSAGNSLLVLQSGPYELWYHSGVLTINNGNGYTLRRYDLGQLFGVDNPEEIWGDVYAMLQGDRLTLIVQYQNEDEGKAGGQGLDRQAYGIRNLAAGFDLSTGNCTAVEKMKRGRIALWESEGEMLYLVHTDVDRDTNLYKWDAASFSTGAFVYVNTASGSYERDQLLRLTGMELKRDGRLALTGLDAYAYEQAVTLTVDLKTGGAVRQPEPVVVDPAAAPRPLLVSGVYRQGGETAARHAARYHLMRDGTFLWLPGQAGYATPQAVSPVIGRGGGWRLEGDNLVLTTMCIAEVTGGTLQRTDSFGGGWQLVGETRLRALRPGEYITETLPFRVQDPNGLSISVDGQLYIHAYRDLAGALQGMLRPGGSGGQPGAALPDLSDYYHIWQHLAGVEL